MKIKPDPYKPREVVYHAPEPRVPEPKADVYVMRHEAMVRDVDAVGLAIDTAVRKGWTFVQMSATQQVGFPGSIHVVLLFRIPEKE